MVYSITQRQDLWRHSLLSECPRVSQYNCQCSFIYIHKTSVCYLPCTDLTNLTNTPQHCVRISFTDFDPNRSVAVDRTDINSLKSPQAVGVFHCANFHLTHNFPAALFCGDFLYRVSPVSIKRRSKVAVVNACRPLSTVGLSLRWFSRNSRLVGSIL